MGFGLSPYQKQFREKLRPEYKEQFDEVAKLAEAASDVTGFVNSLPDAFKPVVASAKSTEQAVELVFSNTDWGTDTDNKALDYTPPKATLGKKLAAKTADKPAAPAPAGEAPTKRRGNPEALRKAREARGMKSKELVAADRQTVIDSTVAYLKANAGTQPIKPLVAALIEILKGKGTNGTNLTESFIYTTITNTGKEDTAPFKPVDMADKRRGYDLK